MISEPKDRNRNVIPRWRGFRQAAALGELSPAVARFAKEGVQLTTHALDRNLKEWENAPSLRSAGDLVLSAIVSGLRTNPVVEAARFLTSEKSTAVPALQSLAEQLLFSSTDLPTLPSKALPVQRSFTISEPKNPLAWSDLALSYTATGSLKKAERAISVATQLAPDSRHVLRIAACFYSHINDPQKANDLLNRSSATGYDPWLASAEIATANEAKIGSKHAKAARDKLAREEFSKRDIAELASALATTELSSGNVSRSKKLFRLSMEDPTENAVAQAEWVVLRKHVVLNVSDQDRSLPKAHEAVAINAYREHDWKKCVESLILWQLDQPFRARPALLGSTIASDLLANDEVALEFTKVGLLGNPHHPVLHNNAAVSYARMGHLQMAIKHLAMGMAAVDRDDIVTAIVLRATKGLVAFRSHDSEAGRAHYEAAIDEAVATNNARLAARAYLYLLQEEAFNDPFSARFALEALEPLSRVNVDESLQDCLAVTKRKLELLSAATGNSLTADRQTVGRYARLETIYVPKLSLMVPMG